MTTRIELSETAPAQVSEYLEVRSSGLVRLERRSVLGEPQVDWIGKSGGELVLCQKRGPRRVVRTALSAESWARKWIEALEGSEHLYNFVLE